MTESEARDWVLVWVEGLHRRAGSKCFWEKEQERIDLGTSCLVLSCSLWEVRPTYRLSQWHDMTCFFQKRFSQNCYFSKNACFLPVGANLPPKLIPSLLLLIQSLDFIFYKILPSLNIMMTADFLFLPKVAHLFIYLLLKSLSSKLLTCPLPTKRIRVQPKDCTLTTLSHWFFSSQSRLGFFL